MQGMSAIWIKVPILQSHLIPEAANQGFEFHHAEHDQSVLKLWLHDDKEDLIPRFATHQIGVSGQISFSVRSELDHISLSLRSE